MSLILRHQPETIGLQLDENGWADVSQLLESCESHGKKFSFAELVEVVETNDKKRFIFDESKQKIRASQGHSIKVDVEFEKRTPPEFLFHGTAERNLEKILSEGLSKMKRHHVHLTDNLETARQVGIRYGKPVILQINCAEMTAEGFEFFISANNVWLVESVPAKFLKAL